MMAGFVILVVRDERFVFYLFLFLLFIFSLCVLHVHSAFSCLSLLIHFEPRFLWELPKPVLS